MSLLVVRHAHAGSRSAWTGDDRLRPLSEKGVKQALGVADSLGPHRPRRIVSSPAIRCTTTVQPLAEQLGMEVEVDDRLFEDAGDADVRSLLREVQPTPTVLCSHGDVIPRMLRSLMDDGMVPDDDLRWAKASTWVVERVGDGWGRGSYLPAPVQ